MKLVGAAFFLSSGFFALMSIIGYAAGWSQNAVALAISSLVFGALGTAAGVFLQRRTRLLSAHE
ncbi:hypothetical protein [Lysobacter sp. P5_B9]